MRKMGFVSLLLILTTIIVLTSAAFAEEETLRTKRPTLEQLGYYPEDGELVRVNPPYFLWMPERDAVSYEVELSSTPDFNEKQVFTDIKHSVVLMHEPLENGETYYWRYRYIDADGNYSLYSITREFTISKSAGDLLRATA